MEHLVVSNLNRIYGASSRGTQPKWYIGGCFVKADIWGYEGLSECIASKFLHYVRDVEFADYYPCKITDVSNGNKEYYGCYSYDFTKGTDYSVISVFTLMQKSGNSGWYRLKGVDLVDCVVDTLFSVTGLDMRKYLGALLSLDALILNEDRHYRNIAVLRDDKGYAYCPFFDQGLSLLSDVHTNPLDTKFIDAVKTVSARPFSAKYLEQLKWLNAKPLTIDYDNLVYDMKEWSFEYKHEYVERAINCLKLQLKLLEGVVWIKG